jgi:pentatricopeptide repeat protein
VETVPKRGYRLALTVKKFEPSQTKSALSASISSLPLAYSHYAAGDREANDPSPAGQARAVLLFEEAARVDPKFAAAHAAVADTRMYQLVRGDLVPADGLKLGLEACRSALAANPTLVQGLSILAWFKGAMLGEYDEAHTLLDEALAIDPGYSRAHVYRSWIFRNEGLARESTVAAQRGAELNPHALLNRHSYSWALFCNDRVADALAHEKTLQRMYPLDDVAQAYTGIFAAYLGNYREALEAIEAAIRISAERPAVCAGAAYVFAKAGKTERALQLAEAAAAAIVPRAPRPILAAAYAELGDVDRALDLLSEARDEGCVWFDPARLDPRLASLKSDDRFLALFS